MVWPLIVYTDKALNVTALSCISPVAVKVLTVVRSFYAPQKVLFKRFLGFYFLSAPSLPATGLI